MALNEIQQIEKLINDSKNILLVFGAQKIDDNAAAALALKLFLGKMNKETCAASEDFFPARHLRFLQNIDTIKGALSNLYKTIIKVDISKTKLDSVSYEIKDNVLSVFLSPKEGAITNDNIHTVANNFKFDLIITIGAQDLNSLGEIFLRNTDLFYKTPIINFDNHAGNEHFGQINIVEPTASSNSEIIFKALEQFGAAYIDDKIAMCFLTGMISLTNSFKTPNVSPTTLAIAGRLMNLGADREKIIQNLYRTKSVSSLKLWGRALSNLQHDKEHGIMWTTITRDDFIRAGAGEEDLRGIISELITNSPEAKIVLLLHEFYDLKHSGKIRVFLVTNNDHNACEIMMTYNPQGNKKSASFVLDEKTLNEAENELFEVLKKAV